MCFTIICPPIIWTASSDLGTYRLCEQRRFRRACACAQSRQNLRCSLIQAVSQEEPSDRKPDPWPLWLSGHAQLKFVMTECSKTQIRLTGLICSEGREDSGTNMYPNVWADLWIILGIIVLYSPILIQSRSLQPVWYFCLNFVSYFKLLFPQKLKNCLLCFPWSGKKLRGSYHLCTRHR